MKIVVLDDSKTVLLTIQALLEELEVPSTSIFMFTDGHKALESIEKEGADIIFSDINMSNMDGFEFVGRLFALSERFVSTLFVVSADEQFRDINKMRNVRAKRFIRKPIDMRHFNHFVAPEIRKRLLKSTNPRDDELDGALDFLSHQDEPSEGIDYEELALKMGTRVKHIPTLLASFIEESHGIIERLKDAVEHNMINEIQQCAHSLKGSAGNMQFFDLSELCREMELVAQEGSKGFDYSALSKEIQEELRGIELKVNLVK
jgi:CheY-like chemotaxis protein